MNGRELWEDNWPQPTLLEFTLCMRLISLPCALRPLSTRVPELLGTLAQKVVFLTAFDEPRSEEMGHVLLQIYVWSQADFLLVLSQRCLSSAAHEFPLEGSHGEPP